MSCRKDKPKGGPRGRWDLSVFTSVPVPGPSGQSECRSQRCHQVAAGTPFPAGRPEAGGNPFRDSLQS